MLTRGARSGNCNVECQNAVMGKHDGTPRDSLIEEGQRTLVVRSRLIWNRQVINRMVWKFHIGDFTSKSHEK